jgi:hypothetical protein
LPKKENEPIDWKGIERDYRAGVMSIREIAKWYGVSHTAINKRAKAEGWTREAQPRHFDRKALVGEIVSVKVDAKPEELTGRARGMAARLLDELDTVTANVGQLEEMIETEESDPRRRGALMKAISLGERARTLKDITATMKTLTETEQPDGKKAARQDSAERASSGGKFRVPQAPGTRPVVN